MRQASGAAALPDDNAQSALSPETGRDSQVLSNVLFLQGPVGPFFSRMASDFAARGFTVYKINFNGGDKFFYRHGKATDYTGTQDQWSEYLSTYIKKNSISRVYVFGDCRFYHREAKKVVDTLGVELHVFEEGYVRPNFITLESGGVNGYSPLMNRSSIVGVTSPTDDSELPAGRFGFAIPAVLSIVYYLSARYHRGTFYDYVHHRPFGCVSEGAIWIRAGLRKLMSRGEGRRVVSVLENRFQNQYFVCPLQVHCDMQVLVHSPFKTIDQFICDVLISFAKNAPANRALVFKHHPMDRGYTNYKPLISEMSKALQIEERVFYVHDVCLPILLRKAEGSVMINSTVGMSSFFHGTPVKALGAAIYDRRGLTFQGSLDDFWKKPGVVDADAVARFRSFLIRNNQLNGNLYRRSSDESVAGVVWSGKLLAQHSLSQSVDQRDELRHRVRLVVGNNVGAANTEISFDDSDKISKSA